LVSTKAAFVCLEPDALESRTGTETGCEAGPKKAENKDKSGAGSCEY
jgi:hypothetical protein